MIARVFAPAASRSGDVVDVPGDESRWLRDVLRLAPGDRVRTFNGRGGEWEARLVACAKSGSTVSLDNAVVPVAETRVAYTLAVAVLKGDGTDTAVRDAVMMGAAAIRPFVCGRTAIGRAALGRAHRRGRWERVAVASAKQCGRAVVPVVHDVVDFGALLTEGAVAGDVRLVLVEPALGAGAEALSAIPAPSSVSIAIGPEGGWIPDEVAAAVAAGWRPLSLGARVIRADAAPMVALAACQAVWHDA